eukprot:485898_1
MYYYQLKLYVLLICLSLTFAYDEYNFVMTPFGGWLKECVHTVKAGSHIVNYDDHFMVINDEKQYKIQRCKTPNPYWTSKKDTINSTQATFGEGWQAYIKQNSESNDISSFLGNWTVPPLPTKPSEIEVLYTFTGLQNIDWVPPEIPPLNRSFDIIQPVLGYGARSATGGGSFWSIASWYVTLGIDVIQSEIIKVEPGDIIFGNMTKINNNGTWYIDSVNMNNGQHTDFTVSRSILVSQPWIYVTLEVYDIWSCSEYPLKSTIPYTNLYATNGNKPFVFNWKIESNPITPPICNESMTVDNNDGTDVTIYF